MEFDLKFTALAFVAIIAVSVGGASMSPMGVDTVVMMVLPSAVIFGIVMMVLGVKHGEYRAKNT